MTPYRPTPKRAYIKKLRNGSETVSGNLVTRNAPFVLRRYKYIPPGGKGIDPYAYLRDLLTRLPTLTNHQISEVTPTAWAKSLKNSSKAKP